jgi:hypothetical protein
MFSWKQKYYENVDLVPGDHGDNISRLETLKLSENVSDYYLSCTANTHQRMTRPKGSSRRTKAPTGKVLLESR